MSDPHDPYFVLEVARHARAEVIEAAFSVLREQALRDEGPDAPSRLAALNRAHATLGDPHRRAAYDGAAG
jgi:curved DNA-binding protein CbpA